MRPGCRLQMYFQPNTIRSIKTRKALRLNIALAKNATSRALTVILVAAGVRSQSMSESPETVKVLVVDDEPEVEVMFRQRMRRDIRSGRYEFVFACSGVHALEVLAEHPDVKLVITDLNMPEMDGLTLLNCLADAWPGVPSLVVSAYGDSGRMSEARERGSVGFVVKPVDFDLLRSAMVDSLEAAG